MLRKPRVWALHSVPVVLQTASLGTCSQGKQDGCVNDSTPPPSLTLSEAAVSLLPELLGNSHSTYMERQGGAARTLKRLGAEEWASASDDKPTELSHLLRQRPLQSSRPAPLSFPQRDMLQPPCPLSCRVTMPSVPLHRCPGTVACSHCGCCPDRVGWALALLTPGARPC